MSKIKVSIEDKIHAVNLYLDGKESQHRIASMFGVSIASVQQWIRNYESMGADAFTLKGNKRYSKELKQQAVLDYLSGRGSQDDICKRYGIRSKAKLQIWIKKYNGHEELKASGTGDAVIHNARCFLKVREEFGTFSDYLWGFTGKKSILYMGHQKGALPAKNGLSDTVSKRRDRES